MKKERPETERDKKLRKKQRQAANALNESNRDASNLSAMERDALKMGDPRFTVSQPA